MVPQLTQAGSQLDKVVCLRTWAEFEFGLWNVSASLICIRSCWRARNPVSKQGKNLAPKSREKPARGGGGGSPPSAGTKDDPKSSSDPKKNVSGLVLGCIEDKLCKQNC